MKPTLGELPAWAMRVACLASASLVVACAASRPRRPSQLVYAVAPPGSAPAQRPGPTQDGAGADGQRILFRNGEPSSGAEDAHSTCWGSAAQNQQCAALRPGARCQLVAVPHAGPCSGAQMGPGIAYADACVCNCSADYEQAQRAALEQAQRCKNVP